MIDLLRAADAQRLRPHPHPVPPDHDVEVGDGAIDERAEHRGLALEVEVLSLPQPLRAAGIPFEIGPGVTAALAAAAAAGVPLTSRAAASSVTILTGHEADEKAETLDFPALASLPGTLAIYMGVEQVNRWSRALIAAGKPAATPVTVISRCSWPDQQIAVTTLGECGTEFERCGWPAPAVVIVGEVADVPRPESGTSPSLAGRRVLITRPRAQGDELATLITSLGGACVHVPVIRIEPPSSWAPLDRAISQSDTFDWIVFASVNGVHAFSERLRAARLDGRHLGTARLAAIGSATARALESVSIGGGRRGVGNNGPGRTVPTHPGRPRPRRDAPGTRITGASRD